MNHIINFKTKQELKPGESQKDIQQKALREAKEQLNHYIEVTRIVAEQLKHYYNALVEEGFTDEQALKIVIAHGIIPGGVPPME